MGKQRPAAVMPKRVNTEINRGRRSSPPVACGLIAEGPWSWAELASPGWDDWAARGGTSKLARTSHSTARPRRKPASSFLWPCSKCHRSLLSQGAAQGAAVQPPPGQGGSGSQAQGEPAQPVVLLSDAQRLRVLSPSPKLPLDASRGY